MKIEHNNGLATISYYQGLNPYSNGMKIERCTEVTRCTVPRLNPYSNGMKIELAFFAQEIWDKTVLILILME